MGSQLLLMIGVLEGSGSYVVSKIRLNYGVVDEREYTNHFILYQIKLMKKI